MLGAGDIKKALEGLGKTAEQMDAMVILLKSVETLITEQNDILRKIASRGFIA